MTSTLRSDVLFRLPTTTCLLSTMVACLAATPSRADAPAVAMVAQRPGVMCVTADALSRLTLPSGASRSAGPAASARDVATKRAGGCIDIPPAARVTVQVARRNTSIVSYDAHDGQGVRTFIVPNIDFAPAVAAPAGSPPAVATGSAAQAPASASQAPAPGATASAGQPISLPPVLNYASAVIALVHQTPALATDDAVVRWWALNRFLLAYRQLQNQEFRLQPLLRQSRDDLAATLAATRPRTRQLVLNASLGQYDFARSAFPLQIGGNRVSFPMSPCCIQSPMLPDAVQIDIAGLDAVDAVPMASDIAQAFVERHTVYGNVDRRVELLLTVGLDPLGITRSAGGPASATGRLETLEVLSAQREGFELVHHFTNGQLTALRTAKAAKDEAAARQQSEAQRQQQLAAQATFQQQQMDARRTQIQSQRQQLVAELSQQSGSVRLRNFITGGLYAGAAPLDNLRGARARALLTGSETPVAMLVQAGSPRGGLVTTSWPGLLSIVAVGGQTRLADGEWYLVSGELRVPPGDDLPAAELRASAVFHCARAACADAAEPEAVVDHMLARLTP